MSKNKLSLVIAASDGLEFTLQCVQSAKENTVTKHEIIVIDNNSKDGTNAWLQSQSVKIIKTDKLETYSKAINMGLEAASKESNYLAVLNNDLIFTKGWDLKLIEAIEHPEIMPGIDKIGMAGPMSNHAAGFQSITDQRYNVSICHQFAAALEKDIMKECKRKGVPYVQQAGFLSGFCWIMTRECYEEVGGLEEYPNNYNGFEDNDYVLRANLSGFATVIAKNAFVHHYGGQTFARLRLDNQKRGLINRFPFYDKWKAKNDLIPFLDTKDVTCKSFHYYDYMTKSKKLVAGYRVKNVGRWFARVLTKMSTIADEIIVFDDHSEDNTVEIAKTFPKVTIYRSDFTTFNEARDREFLFQKCKERDPDWIIITDGDEELEEKFDRKAAEKLMNPMKPNIFAYIFRYITHWDSEDMQRTDGIFGNMANVRMVRNMPNQHIVSSHPQGFHCNSVPWVPIENVGITPYRIRHYGYVDYADRLRKYQWYTKMDTNKLVSAIGSQDYSHLVDIQVRLIKYSPKVTLGLTMIARNESDNLEIFLDNYHGMFDQMVIVDTGSKDNTKLIAERYGAEVYDYVWKDDFADARNFAKSKCTTDWCFQLDPDERVSHGTMGIDMFRFYRMIEEPVLAYFFSVINYLPNGKPFRSENVRLFKNLPEIVYKGEVHESVSDSIAELKLFGKTIYVGTPNDCLHHYGYLKNPVDVEKKMRRYAGICERRLAKDPNDAMAHFSLALHELNSGKTDDAIEHLEQAIIHNPRFVQSHSQLAHIYLSKARKVLEDATNNSDPKLPLYAANKALLDYITPVAENQTIVGLPNEKDIVPD